MSYNFLLDSKANNGTFVCEANINFAEFKNDIIRIIHKDDDFVSIVAKALFSSRLIKDRARECLEMLDRPVYITIEDKQGVFHYKRNGSYDDTVLVLAIAFAMQADLGRIFFEAIKAQIKDDCNCSKCRERRKEKSSKESPTESREAIDELIKEFKKGSK